MLKRMKIIVQVLEILFVSGIFIFLVVFFSFETVHPDESFARDLLGFPIPQSGFLFFFSLHGITGTVIAVLLFYVVKFFASVNKGETVQLPKG